MASNDEVVFGIPHLECPSCGYTFDLSRDRRIDKLSKAQIRQRSRTDTYQETAKARFGDAGEPPSDFPENNFIVLTCGSPHCEQYSKFKVFRIPRIATASAKVEL